MSNQSQPTDNKRPYGYNPEDPIDPRLMPLVSFVNNNRAHICQIYDMDHLERGLSNPENNDNPGCLVVTRTTEDKVDIFYLPWSEMETKLQTAVAVEKGNNKIVLLILIDKITTASVMISVDRQTG